MSVALTNAIDTLRPRRLFGDFGDSTDTDSASGTGAVEGSHSSSVPHTPTSADGSSIGGGSGGTTAPAAGTEVAGIGAPPPAAAAAAMSQSILMGGIGLLGDDYDELLETDEPEFATMFGGADVPSMPPACAAASPLPWRPCSAPPPVQVSDALGSPRATPSPPSLAPLPPQQGVSFGGFGALGGGSGFGALAAAAHFLPRRCAPSPSPPPMLPSTSLEAASAAMRGMHNQSPSLALAVARVAAGRAGSDAGGASSCASSCATPSRAPLPLRPPTPGAPGSNVRRTIGLLEGGMLDDGAGSDFDGSPGADSPGACVPMSLTDTALMQLTSDLNEFSIGQPMPAPGSKRSFDGR